MAQFNNNIHLYGTEDYINIGNMGSAPPQGTISMFLYYDGPPNVFSNAFTTNLAGLNSNCFRLEASNSLALVSGDASSYDIHTFLSNLTPGNWYKIDFVYDMTTNNAKGYVNGVLVFDESNTHWPNSFPDVKIGVGYNTARKWIGNIDEVSFWNISRTPFEIQNSYTTELTGTETGLVAYYRMNQGGMGQGLVVPNTSTAAASGGTALNGITVGTATTPLFFSATPPCTTNLLANPGFETPVVPNNGDNLLGSSVIDDWTMTGGTGFNIIKPGGTYGAGPDYPKDGSQYVEVAFGTGTVFQDFTITGNGTNVNFGGYFSSRTGAPWSLNIQIFAMPGNTLVASSSTVSYQNQGTEWWLYSSGTATLNAGLYRYVAYIDDDANFDAAFVNKSCTLPLSAGIVHYVNSAAGPGTAPYTSWATAGNDLQSVINVCSPGDSVWIATGTYKPNNYPGGATGSDIRDFSFYVPDGVKIFGGFNGSETGFSQRNITANPVMLSGDIGNMNDATDNCYHVLVLSGPPLEGLGTEVNGFFITGGNANGSLSQTLSVNGNDIYKSDGGAVYIKYGNNAIINNKIYNNSAIEAGGAVFALRDTTVFKNNAFYNNTVNNGNGGGLSFGLGMDTLVNNLIYGNSSTEGGGISIFGGNNTLVNNTFFNNGANTGGAVETNSGNNDFTNNIFWNNTLSGQNNISGADYMNDGASNVFYNNLLQLPAAAYTGFNYDLGTNSGNLFALNPLFVNTGNPAGADGIGGTADDGLQIIYTSPCINAGNNTGAPNDDITGTIRMANPDIGAFENVFLCPAGNTLYVDSSILISGNGVSWGTAFKNLYEALDIAWKCPQVEKIYVARGTYTPMRMPYEMGADKKGTLVANSNNRNKTFHLRTGLELFGGYPSGGGSRNISANATKLDGSNVGGVNTDSAYHVVLIDSSANWATANDTTVVDGFNITHGKADGSSTLTVNENNLDQTYGGAIYIRNGISRLENDSLYNNFAADQGGSVCQYYASTQISHSAFSNNRAVYNGGAVFSRYGKINVSYSSIHENNSPGGVGGALSFYNGSGQISYCNLSNNSASNGGAIYTNLDTFSMNGCNLNNNTSTSGHGGAIFNFYGSSLITGNTLNNNSAVSGGKGGAIYGQEGNLTVLGNTIHHNTAISGGGICLYNCNDSLTNNYIYNNSANNSYPNRGGGIFLFQSNNKLTDNSLYNNSSYEGGGISTDGGSDTLNNNTINNNTATSGGGLELLSNIISLTANYIHHNNAQDDAGISAYSSSGTISLQSNKIQNNQATHNTGGGEIYAFNCNFVNNIVDSNIANNIVGGISINCASQSTISGNTVSNNQGGGIIAAGNLIITNNAIYKNVGGSGSGLRAYGKLLIANNTFISNTAMNIIYGGGALAIDNFLTKAEMDNNIFWDNRKGSEDNVAGADYISSSISSDSIISRNNFMQLPASNYSPGINNLGSNTGNFFAVNPLFSSPGNPVGADAIPRTSDDGLVLLPCSPAINAGIITTPALPTDIIGNNRISAYDIGAYEYQGSSAPGISLAPGNLQFTMIQAATTFYGLCTDLIAKVSSTGSSPVNGNTTAKVWIENSQPVQFVKRHYEITPAINGSSSTGRITLYFTQQEFDDFNAVNAVKLPSGPSDISGISNLIIEKRNGVSANGSGLPASYSGTVTTINPPDSDIIWDASQNWWEISFDVSGFSGFFIKTYTSILPLHLLAFSGQKQNNAVNLFWQTSNEINSKHFIIQRSGNGINFSDIGKVDARNAPGNNQYLFTDPAPFAGVNYYRLQIVDKDGKYNFSSIIKIVFSGKTSFSFYPNPAQDNITVSGTIPASKIRILNTIGEIMMQVIISSSSQVIYLRNLPAGIYFLQYDDGLNIENHKFIKN